MDDFISEDDLKTFEGWLRYQGVSPASDAELEEWRRLFEGVRQRANAAPKVGLMKLQPIQGEYRYALALRDGDDLWLTLWVRRSRKGEFFVMIPRGERDWNIHTSYHLDGTMHMKTHGSIVLSPQKRQPLTGNFRGAEHLGAYAGHSKSIGAVCDPSAFTGVVEVPPGILGPRHGQVTVDLVEPDHEPVPFPWERIAVQRTFRDAAPWVVITVGTT
jgi:hypothetical protein